MPTFSRITAASWPFRTRARRLAQAAVVAASMNVYINAASMDDEARADRYRAEADRLIAEANERADGILAYTMDAIR